MFKYLRKRVNITQFELSKILKVSQSTVSMWEIGKSKPPITKISLLAEALNVSESEILKCFTDKSIV